MFFLYTFLDYAGIEQSGMKKVMLYAKQKQNYKNKLCRLSKANYTYVQH